VVATAPHALLLVALGLPVKAVEHGRDCKKVQSATAWQVGGKLAPRLAGRFHPSIAGARAGAEQEGGGNRPKPRSALRNEGDLQLMIASFAGARAQERVQEVSDGTARRI
jgi:hypothetical protein